VKAPSIVACLAGAATASELVAEALLALDAVARLHSVCLQPIHVSFGETALAETGRALPETSRTAVLTADAVLAAGADEPALTDLMAELDVRARVTRVRFGRTNDVEVVAPVGKTASEWSLERAFALAERRRLNLAVIGDATWEEQAWSVGAEHEHVRVEFLSPVVAVPLAAFDAARFDVVAVSDQWAERIVEIVAAPVEARIAAHALLAEHGPSLFLPAPDGGFALAGQGDVNLSSILLASALLLEYGLNEAAPAATLAGAVSAALVDAPKIPGLPGERLVASAREFTTQVVGGFQMSIRNSEFWSEAAQ
jgi:isocitrate/isopropylmalate dehydrogenase